MHLLSRNAVTLLAICALAWPQQLSKVPPSNKVQSAEDRDLSNVVRDMISARGIDHWSETEMLMSLTGPPAQPIHSVPEWEKSRGVVFALDSDITTSFELNRRAKTVDNPRPVYERRPQLVEVLNELICGDDEDADDDGTDGDSDARDDSAIRKKEATGCDGSQLDATALDRAFDRLALAHDFLAMVSGLANSLDVLLLVNGSGTNELQVDRVVEQMRNFRAGRDLLRSQHVYFLQTRFDTKWIRDYGPTFVRDSGGALTAVDTRYDPEATEQSTRVKSLLESVKALVTPARREDASADEAEEDKRGRLSDDEAPSLMSERFRQLHGTYLQRSPVSVVRPPIVLSGGDYMTDGQGTAITSLRTLRENGGNVEQLDLSLKKYMGANQVVYLHPLPGQTVKHIDMFLQFAAPNVILLGKFGRMPRDPAEIRLQSAASAALEDNLKILRDYYQSSGKAVNVIDQDVFTLDLHAVNIVRIPMPPVSRPLFGTLQRALKAASDAMRDYQEHSTLLRLLGRIDKQALLVAQNHKALSELEREAAEGHQADEHDDEVIEALKTSVSETSKAISHYSSVSGEYEREAKALQALAVPVLSAMDRLHQAVLKAADERPLDAADLRPALARVTELERAVAAFQKQVQGDHDKDSDLKSASEIRLLLAYNHVKEVERLYRYGTDLYRTHLNMLQVRTADHTVLAIPTYRDRSVQQEEEAATSRIRRVFSLLYSNIQVVPAPSDAFIKELGSVHCLTRVLPIDLDFVKSDWNRADTGLAAQTLPKR